MNKPAPFLDFLNDIWVNTILQKMTLNEKIGQLFQVASFSNRDQKHTDEVSLLIKDFHLGGLTFFQGTAKEQVRLTNHYQKISKVPLFINIDAEWGLGMRLTGASKFPYQMALGAIQDDSLIFQMAKQIAKDCKLIGVSSPLAPVIDINNNPKNPVINYRSFGENKELVAQKGIAYMKGLQSENILDNAKHFPGHGDTSVDSHIALPVLNHSNERLHQLELYPFKKLIREGLSSLMTAHLSIPIWEKKENTPVTLSQTILSEILFDELKFEGLVITDALDMQGITNFFKEGEADLKAILAGNHIITNSQSVALGVKKIKEAILNGRWSEEKLNAVVRKILAMKKWVGLDDFSPILEKDFDLLLNNNETSLLNQQLAQESITQLGTTTFSPLNKSRNTALFKIKGQPTTISERDKVAHHLKEINKSENDFIDEKYTQYVDQFFSWDVYEEESKYSTILAKLLKYDHVIISLHGVNIKPFNHFDIPLKVRKELLQKIADKKVTLLLFGNAYAFDELENNDAINHIFIAYQDGIYQQKAVLNCLLGEEPTRGKLPVSIEGYKQGEGI